MALQLFSGDPFATMREFERMIDRSMGAAFDKRMSPASNGDAWGTIATAGLPKPMDVVEYDTHFEVVADAPGMSPEDISVEYHAGVLTVKGTHATTKTDKDARGRVYRSERSTQSFSRSFALPKNATEEGIAATLDKGVLHVAIPKLPEPEKPTPKRIAVKAAGAAGPSGFA